MVTLPSDKSLSQTLCPAASRPPPAFTDIFSPGPRTGGFQSSFAIETERNNISNNISAQPSSRAAIRGLQSSRPAAPRPKPLTLHKTTSRRRSMSAPTSRARTLRRSASLLTLAQAEQQIPCGPVRRTQSLENDQLPSPGMLAPPTVDEAGDYRAKVTVENAGRSGESGRGRRSFAQAARVVKVMSTILRAFKLRRGELGVAPKAPAATAKSQAAGCSPKLPPESPGKRPRVMKKCEGVAPVGELSEDVAGADCSPTVASPSSSVPHPPSDDSRHSDDSAQPPSLEPPSSASSAETYSDNFENLFYRQPVPTLPLTHQDTPHSVFEHASSTVPGLEARRLSRISTASSSSSTFLACHWDELDGLFRHSAGDHVDDVGIDANVNVKRRDEGAWPSDPRHGLTDPSTLPSIDAAPVPIAAILMHN